MNIFLLLNRKQVFLLNGIYILECEPLKQPLNFKYYKDIHRYLFEDLYEWAGTLRTVNISKKGTNFCPVNDLEFLCDACFQHLENTNYFWLKRLLVTNI